MHQLSGDENEALVCHKLSLCILIDTIILPKQISWLKRIASIQLIQSPTLLTFSSQSIPGMASVKRRTRLG